MLAMIMTFAFAAAVAGLLLVIPRLIAPRRPTAVKAAPFECGKDPLEIAEGRFAIKFSTIAIFFILIDIELLFIWPWAMLYRRLGWFGFAEMLVFQLAQLWSLDPQRVGTGLAEHVDVIRQVRATFAKSGAIEPTIAALVLPTSNVWSQMPLDGAPLAQPGRYEVISEAAVGSPRHIVFRPANLDAFPQEDTLPVVVWANGGCSTDSRPYAAFLTKRLLASSSANMRSP